MRNEATKPNWGHGSFMTVGKDLMELRWTPGEEASRGVRFVLTAEGSNCWQPLLVSPSAGGFHRVADGCLIATAALKWSLAYSAIHREVGLLDWLQATALLSRELWLSRLEVNPGVTAGGAGWSAKPKDGTLSLNILLRDRAHLFLLRVSGSQSWSEGWKEVALAAMSRFQLLGSPGSALCESIVVEAFGARGGWSFQRFSSWKCSVAAASETFAWSPDCLGLARVDNEVNGRAFGLLRLSLWPAGRSTVELWCHQAAMLRKMGFTVPGVSVLDGAASQPWTARQGVTVTLWQGHAEFDIDFQVLNHHSGKLAIVGCWPSLGTSPDWWAIHRCAMKLLVVSSRPPEEQEADGSQF